MTDQEPLDQQQQNNILGSTITGGATCPRHATKHRLGCTPRAHKQPGFNLGAQCVRPSPAGWRRLTEERNSQREILDDVTQAAPLRRGTTVQNLTDPHHPQRWSDRAQRQQTAALRFKPLADPQADRQPPSVQDPATEALTARGRGVGLLLGVSWRNFRSFVPFSVGCLPISRLWLSQGAWV